MPSRQLSQEETREAILSKPHKYEKGAYVEDKFFEGSHFPEWKHRYVAVFEKQEDGEKVLAPKLESKVIETPEIEKGLEGSWYDSPAKAMRAFQAHQEKKGS